MTCGRKRSLPAHRVLARQRLHGGSRGDCGLASIASGRAPKTQASVQGLAVEQQGMTASDEATQLIGLGVGKEQELTATITTSEESNIMQGQLTDLQIESRRSKPGSDRHARRLRLRSLHIIILEFHGFEALRTPVVGLCFSNVQGGDGLLAAGCGCNGPLPSTRPLYCKQGEAGDNGHCGSHAASRSHTRDAAAHTGARLMGSVQQTRWQWQH